MLAAEKVDHNLERSSAFMAAALRSLILFGYSTLPIAVKRYRPSAIRRVPRQ